MPERAPDAPAEHLYRAQEAAGFLGIHRATLHLAVKRNLLVPDNLTPGGHARFRRETLEAFAQRLARPSVTSGAHLLPELARTLPLPNGSQAFCQLAFARIRQAVPALTMCGVAVRSPTPADPQALAQVAQEGFPPQLGEMFAQLRPHLEFGVTTVLRTHLPEVCADTIKTRTLRLGTERLVRRGGMGAYAVLPMLLGDEAHGVLVGASMKPHHFPAWEVSYLQSIADELAVALVCHDQIVRMRTQLAATAELIQSALELRAGPAGLPAIAQRDGAHSRSLEPAMAQLCAQFIACSDATVADVLPPSGFPAAADVGHADNGHADVGQRRVTDDERVRRLRALLATVSHARTGDACQRTRWVDEDGPQTAVALSLPVARGERIAVGAIWRGERVEQAGDEALLVAFGGACALALGLDTFEPGDAP